MTLKSTELTRAEYMTEAERTAYNIDAKEGLVVVEVRNKNLHEEHKLAKKGYVAYLRSLAAYKPADATWASP